MISKVTDNLENTDFILKILRLICQEAKETLIVASHRRADGVFGPMAGVEEVVARRKSGDFRPVVIYGFENRKRIMKRQGGSILKASGVFYLQLPASLAFVKRVFRKAAKTRVSDQKAIDSRNAIQEIRAFKHRFDNVCLSLKAYAHRAEKALKDSPQARPSALKEFRRSRLEKYTQEYRGLDSMARELGLKEADQVLNRMEEALRLTEEISLASMSPEDSVALALKCLENIQNVARILNGAKELENRE